MSHLTDDDDDFFDFDNENFLQGIFDTNKFRKTNQASECLMTTFSNEIVPLENVDVWKSSSNLSNAKKNSPEVPFTLKKNPCTPQNQLKSSMLTLQEHSSIKSNNNNELKTVSSTSQYKPVNAFGYQTIQQIFQEKRPISPKKNGTACKRSYGSVESPENSVLENHKYLDRIGTLISTKSKVSSTNSSVSAKKNKRLSDKLGLINQSSGAVLENQSWKNMLAESDIFSNVLGQFNINWAIKMSTLNLLPNDQVPILIVSLKTINETSKGSHFVTLQDKTGEMEGDIHWINSPFQNVKPGDIFLLREATLFSPSCGLRKHCIIIIPSNIICVWQSNEEVERYCVFDKQHLAAKVRLWLREFARKHDGEASNAKTQEEISIASTSIASDISNQSKENILEEACHFEDDSFDEIIQGDNFEDILKDDETDELLATLEY